MEAQSVFYRYQCFLQSLFHPASSLCNFIQYHVSLCNRVMYKSKVYTKFYVHVKQHQVFVLFNLSTHNKQNRPAIIDCYIFNHVQKSLESDSYLLLQQNLFRQSVNTISNNRCKNSRLVTSVVASVAGFITSMSSDVDISIHYVTALEELIHGSLNIRLLN